MGNYYKRAYSATVSNDNLMDKEPDLQRVLTKPQSVSLVSRILETTNYSKYVQL